MLATARIRNARGSGGETVVVMKTSEYGGSADRGAGEKSGAQSRGGKGGRPPLVDALVGPRCVEVGPVLGGDTPEMSLAQHEDVIEALPA